MKGHLDTLKSRIDEKVQEAREEAIATLKTMQVRMRSMDECKKLPEVRTTELDKPFKELADYITQQPLIAVINDKLRYFEDIGYQKVLARMLKMATPATENPGDKKKPEDGQGHVGEVEVEYIHSRHIRVSYDKAWLADESDVDRYIESLRNALLEEIAKGKKVQI